MKVIVSGGGTAGHIYPALSVAEELKSRGSDVLCVGAVGRMEMERVPAAGFEIKGLEICGFKRSLKPSAIMHNLKVPFMMLRATRAARRIIAEFRPDIVVGFGGYASAPIVKAAQKMGIPTVLQEQNSFAGLTNRMLAKKAKRICTAYEGMERFFGEDKVVLTGNPLKGALSELPQREQAQVQMRLKSGVPTILVTGGSLGTRTLNEMVFEYLSSGSSDNVQIIWQSGKFYYEEFKSRMAGVKSSVNFVLIPFIEKMAAAYGAADLVVCRSGASTVSELQLLGKPALFVPSPNVAEDHQTFNARSVVDRGGAAMVADSDAKELGMKSALELLLDTKRLDAMSKELLKMARPRAKEDVVDILEDILGITPQKRVYFIGVGGIGMSALARFFKREGYSVAGYDRVRTALCEELEKEGIEIHYKDSVELIPEIFKASGTRVIYTPAVPKSHSELEWFNQNGFEVVKRSRALGVLCEGKYTMAVAGTHGKSSTSTMVAWLNHCSSTDGSGSAFLGAISKNFGSNMVVGSGDRMAVEADEFDRSFHALHPAVALVTSVDADHLDIYGTKEEFKKSFEQFAAQCSDAIVVKYGVELSTKSSLKRYSYSLDNNDADFYATNIECSSSGCYSFDIVTPDRTIEGCRLGIPGRLNVENAVGAVALLWQRGFDSERLRTALSSFKGIERRFDMWHNSAGSVYMDDYAHHPEELRAMITSVRDIFAGRHLTVAFQPHLFTRTRDFAAGFSEVLSLADRVILLPIYPAREEPIEGVTSQIILDNITSEKMLVEKSELAQTLKQLPTDVVITAGAGDIDTLRQGVYEVLKDE